MGVAVGVALGVGSAVAALPVLVGVPGTLAQLPSRPADVHAALNSAIDYFRRGDFDLADVYFKRAQANFTELTVDEQQELTALQRLNAESLRKRREGVDQLRQAEKALQEARGAEAAALLRTIMTNQNLAPEDRAKAQHLAEQLNAYPVAPAAPANTTPANTGHNQNYIHPLILARTKLQQARQLMAKANFDAAETLAREAEALKANYQYGEDTPRKVLDDLTRIQTDSKKLLMAARLAYQQGDLDKAEELAQSAERVASSYAFSPLWGDTPGKVLKDVQNSRNRLAAAKGLKSPADPKKPAAASGNEAAHDMLKQGRAALKKGDLEKAQLCANQAQDMNGSFRWWEDNPAKLTADIRAAAKDKPLAGTDILPASAPSKSTAAPLADETNPKALLKLARDKYKTDQLDEAKNLAMKAQAVSGPKEWGLFDDSPAKLMAEIQADQAKRDQLQSVRVLAEARKQFDKGDLDAAVALAEKAEKLHGAYGFWDMGDRPAKLIAEIGVARSKTGLAKAQDANKAILSSKELHPTEPVVVNQKPAVSAAPLAVSAAPIPETTVPVGPTVAVGPQNPAPPEPLPTMNSMTPAPVQNIAAEPPASPVVPAVATSTSAGEVKQQARQLLAEARRLQKENNLVEARQKALEAQKLGASFAAEDDQPEAALAQLADSAHQRIEQLLQEAMDFVATAFMDPSRYQKAEDNLVQARQLAAGFTMDAQPIDSKLSWVQRTRKQAMAQTAAQPDPATADGPAVETPLTTAQTPDPAPPAVDPQQAAGQELLDKARLELTKGELATARRLAVEVFTGPYGLQPQADAVLHSIDAQEFNQKAAEASRTFESGVSAFMNKDYAQAAAILRSVDGLMLKPEMQAKLKEILARPELQPPADVQIAAEPAPAKTAPQTVPEQPMPAAPALETSAQPVVATPLAPKPETSAQPVVATPPAPKPETSFAQQVQALQEVQFQKLRDEGLKAQREATDRFRAGDTTQALEILQAFLATLADAQMEPERLALLQRPIESRLQVFKKLKAQQDFEKEQAGQHESFGHKMAVDAQREEHKKQQVAELMKKYHAMYNEGKYKEAEVAAMQARDLDPDNTAAAAAVHVSHMQNNLTNYRKIKSDREDYFLIEMDEAETVGPAVTARDPLKYDINAWERAKNRKAYPKDGWPLKVKSDKEREIERRLSLLISLDFKNQTLKHVLEDLRDLTGINIVPDMPALDAENISLDRPIDMHLEGVSTKSALELILHQAHLIYIIKDEVVLVTTEAYSKGKLVTTTYQVADLVIPVENHSLTPDPLQNRTNNLPPGAMPLNGSTPFLPGHSLPNGTQVGSPGTSSSSAGSSPIGPHEAPRSPGQTIEETLIKMVKTIKPESWSDMGGPGTVDYYPLGMALVISQTPDIQEQVAELLAALRRLQDIEVAVEVRFITVAESFYERIGMDFNLNIQAQNTKYEPQVIAGQFAPPGFNNVFRPEHFVAGLLPGATTPPGAFTSDLNIPIFSGNNFGKAVPPYGGFPNTLGSDGGLALGLAFLSDIQVFLFLEAAQGDQRTNVMQAPKLTLFNGQNATIEINDNQFFVTNIQTFQVNGQVIFSPGNQAFNLGVQLSIQAVVSADRRFVRLNLNPNLTGLTVPTAALFPVTTFITPVFDTGAQGQPVPFTAYLQQPSISSIRVNTTVNVPDGGTVVLGGLKTLSEGRQEFGTPVLSKLPYVSRLFKNVGYGREAKSLLIMVTPRVIVQEEEEALQVGTGAAGAAVGAGVPPAGGGAQPATR
jgi:Flp pilus assembly secretin CpaC